MKRERSKKESKIAILVLAVLIILTMGLLNMSVLNTQIITANSGSQNETEYRQQSRSVEERIRASVEKALSSPPPLGYEPIPEGVRVLDVKVEGNKITINLSKELLSKGTGLVMEDAVHQILSPLSDVVPEIKNGEYRILVDGIPLNEYLNK